MVIPSDFIERCLPSKVARPPPGPLWVHEIKHDGYRLMARRDCSRVRCFTRNGHDWADRFPAIVDAAHRIKASSFLIDGEAVIARERDTGFHALRSRRHEAVLFAFDLIEHDGDDLRGLPLIDRKRRLARLLGRAKHAIRYSEHLAGDGPTVFEQVVGGHRVETDGCALSQRAVGGVLKSKNPASEAVRRSARSGASPAFMLSPVICSSCLPRSPSGQQDDGEHSRHAENDGGDPGNFDVGNPS